MRILYAQRDPLARGRAPARPKSSGEFGLLFFRESAPVTDLTSPARARLPVGPRERVVATGGPAIPDQADDAPGHTDADPLLPAVSAA